jgi:hypothetical protein
MKQFWLGAVVAALVTGCGSGGGAPFTNAPATPPTTPAPTTPLPASISGDLTSFVYDPAAQTLTITGQSVDGTPLTVAYRRRPALDRGDYQAFTYQAASLTRHTTAYVRDVGPVRGGVVASGPQFGTYSAGGAFQRTEAFDRPDLANNGGIVTYAGTYVGFLNASGDGADLLPVNPVPVDPNLPPTAVPTQAAEVVGSVLINADFADNVVQGLIYNRRVPDGATPNLLVEDLELETTAIQQDGTFVGTGAVEVGNQSVGDYAGVFGGTDAAGVAGALFAEGHIANLADEEEYGLFVLSRCGIAGADPLCNQPNP